MTVDYKMGKGGGTGAALFDTLWAAWTQAADLPRLRSAEGSLLQDYAGTG